MNVVSQGDGLKEIPADSKIPVRPGFLGRLSYVSSWAAAYLGTKGADIVQAINPFYSGPRPFLRALARQRFHAHNFFLLSAGSDSVYWTEGRKRLPYGPFESLLEAEPRVAHFFMGAEARGFNLEIARLARAIIPTAPEYNLSYRGHENLAPMVPFPVNLGGLDYVANSPRRRLVVAHGITRPAAKGTAIIARAFEILSDRYPSDLVLRLYQSTSRTAFLENLQDCDVYVDQIYSLSAGLSALQALALGRVVLGGNESVPTIASSSKTSPVINVRPGVRSIVSAVEGLIPLRGRFPELGYQGRQFVEEEHDHIKVAQRYVDVWKPTS